MILSKNRQRNNLFIKEGKQLLIDIQDFTGKKNSEIAPILGVKYHTLWALESEKSGSEQLKISLQNYLDNLKLRARLVQIETSLKTLGITVPLYEVEGNPMNDAETVRADAISLIGQAAAVSGPKPAPGPSAPPVPAAAPRRGSAPPTTGKPRRRAKPAKQPDEQGA